ncbi:MAG: MerR family transcriptional regulator [Desulfobulbaceae bacterium]|nr:MerR family transcriptional regulator [Desulfobulbaceae bacterium]
MPKTDSQPKGNIPPLLSGGLIRAKDLRSAVSVSYRNLNHWDSLGIISSQRTAKGSGWRNFNFEDTANIQIIVELRKFGMGMQAVKRVIKSIENDFAKYTYLSLVGHKILLVINDQWQGELLAESVVVKQYFSDGKPQIPVLILPFSAYIVRILPAFPIPEGIVPKSVHRGVSEREKAILSIIKKRKWETITIRKSDGSYILKAKSSRRGSFTDKDVVDAINKKNYQNISISTVGGKKITIAEEEVIKI